MKTSRDISREEHKEMFSQLEEMFWGKENEMVLMIGAAPDGKTDIVMGPGMTPRNLVEAYKRMTDLLKEIRLKMQAKR